MDFNSPELDFLGLARSMGLTAFQVSDPDDIVPAFRKAMATEGPVLLDVLTQDEFRSGAM